MTAEPPEQPDSELQRLQSVTDAALSFLGLDELLDELLSRVRDILEVDTTAILLLDQDRSELVARAAKGIEEEVERGVRIPLGRGFAGRVAAERRPIHIPDVATGDILNPLLREKGLRSLLGVPLVVEGDVIGVLHVGSLGERQFSGEDADLLQRAADRAALALRARLTERERGLGEELQRSLLPRVLPSFPGAAVTARYSPAAGDALGGDWYDAFLNRSGTLCMAIGDVLGRGFRAAATMAQLRSAHRAYALEERPPLELVHRLNDLMRDMEPGRSATLLYLVFDPRTASLQLVTAGNPPPLLVSPSGRAAFIEVPSSVPLGATKYPKYAVAEVSLAPGSLLLLYTDGLVERPSESLDTGLERLKSVAQGSVEDLNRWADDVFHALLPPGERSDDAALLAVQTSALGNPLELSLAAERESAALLRRILSRWLADAGATEEETDALVLAAAEACSNAIEHAYPPDPHDFRLRAGEEEGRVWLEVRDWGSWRPPRGENRGRGLMMMEALADSVDVRHGDEGTTVTICHRLGSARAA